MTKFEYLSVLTSIIIGLALANLLSGAGFSQGPRLVGFSSCTEIPRTVGQLLLSRHSREGGNPVTLSFPSSQRKLGPILLLL